MAKKSHNIRRNNKQDGRRVCDIHNNGSINIDVRPNNSTTIHCTTPTGCTFNFNQQPLRQFTLGDQIESGHPILGWVSPEAIAPVKTKGHTSRTKSVPQSTPPSTPHSKSTPWHEIAVIGTAIVAIGYAAFKYFNN